MKERESRTNGLLSACLELTDACKVKCIYCLLENKKPAASRDQMIRIIHALRDYGVVRFSLGGGEPLDVSYIYEVGEEIRALGGIALLRTSACNIIDCEKAKRAFNLIDISVDSSNPDTLKTCKPGINAHIPLINIKNLVSHDVPTRCNILVTKYNQHEVFDTIAWLHAQGVTDVRIQRLVPRGKAKMLYDNLKVSDAEFDDIVRKSVSMGNSLGMVITELKTVNSQTLCIIKPDGILYVGTPKGILEIGSVFDFDSLNKASDMVSINQYQYYKDVIL